MKNLTDGTSYPKKNQARVKLFLRILVALYILYLTKGIIEVSIKGTSSMPIWVVVLVSIVFGLCSVAFIVYAYREYKHSLADIAKEDDTSSPEKSQDDNS